jgi:hypothetical protein
MTTDLPTQSLCHCCAQLRPSDFYCEANQQPGHRKVHCSVFQDRYGRSTVPVRLTQ